MGIEQRSNAGKPPASGTSRAGAAMTRAAVQHRYGPPSVLEASEVEIPAPGRGDVLVRVSAASVHPGDSFVMTGEPYVVRLVIVTARMLSGFALQRLWPFTSVEKREDLLALADLLTTGQVGSVIDRTYPLDEAADALRYVAAGHTRGKVVITV